MMKTQYLFFTGKGGVGKTSIACATAVKLADEGKNVLLVSTDPASNLQDVLESEVTGIIAPVKGLNLLQAININPEVSAQEYRKRVTDPLKNVLPEEQIKKINEGLSGACTTEIASFDEFSRFITGEGNAENYDVIIFDTAPTGHTLRLLELPAAWSDFIGNNPSGASCLGPSSALKSNEIRYKNVVETLRDKTQTTFYLVTRSDKASLKEAAHTSDELKDLGMINQKLLINGVFKSSGNNDEIAVKIEQLAKKELDKIPESLKNLEITTYPLLPYNILGLEKLRSLFQVEKQKEIINSEATKHQEILPDLPGLKEFVESLTLTQSNGLIMTMGKGGVGKTLVASTIATMLAQKGFEVLLTTTDPAAHVQDFMNQLDTIPGNLTIERIDPKKETENYINRVLADKGKNLDEEGKKLLKEDLKSPCTQEVAVFSAFSKAITQARKKFVVMDTAPTGHTLLLLDTTGSYHREILKTTNINPSRIKTPYMFLQDQEFAKILLVALPETTPMLEAESLQNDLKRAGIEPYAWVINQSLSALKGLKDLLLQSRAIAEISIIKTIEEKLATRIYCIPYLPEEKLLPALLRVDTGYV